MSRKRNKVHFYLFAKRANISQSQHSESKQQQESKNEDSGKCPKIPGHAEKAFKINLYLLLTSVIFLIATLTDSLLKELSYVSSLVSIPLFPLSICLEQPACPISPAHGKKITFHTLLMGQLNISDFVPSCFDVLRVFVRVHMAECRLSRYLANIPVLY